MFSRGSAIKDPRFSSCDILVGLHTPGRNGSLYLLCFALLSSGLNLGGAVGATSSPIGASQRGPLLRRT